MSLGPFNCDVWHEILAHLAAHRLVANYSEHRRTRQTLLNAALTSSSLSNIALSVLWRSLSSLEPIIDVINASSPVRLLYYNTYGIRGIWVLRQPPNSDEVRLRVDSYLRRVRTFSVLTPSMKETTLWSTVAKLFDGSRPLLTHLNLLQLSLHPDSATCELIDPLIKLSPKTCKSLVVSVFPQPLPSKAEEAILRLFETLVFRWGDLESLTYEGDVNDDLLNAISSFKGIRRLKVIHDHKVTTCRNATTITELIGRLPALSSLHLDHRTVMPPSRVLDDGLNALQEMELQLYPEDFAGSRSSLGRFICPDLRVLKLEIHGSQHFISWALIFEQLAQTFPRADDLTIDLRGETHNFTALRIQDLDPFFSKSVERLHLLQVPYELTEGDFIFMVNFWTNIRSLALSGAGPAFNTTTMAVISQLHRLEYLCMRVNCMELILNNSSLLKPRNSLEELCLVDPSWTSTLEVASRVARKLRSLFPHLWNVDAIGSFILDLQDALAVLDRNS
ncbi:hypothetical protein NP233_g6501 [Leucocoprinus birnbaumii]|uniref:Uncharacterized protein n=1 Tax=Leucocoprinus birnbaumii TaxID=56174 RepID=A0AAD5VQX4_9AGAR|nr:hypothetical protein NP233_g6501 [Leucocoprinus birnbaumii]